MDETVQELVGRLRDDPDDAHAFQSLTGHDPVEASTALTQTAEATLQRGDSARAMQLFRLALQLDVGQVLAADRYQTLLESAEQWQELVEFLDAYARTLEAAGGDAERIASTYERLSTLWAQVYDRADVAQDYRARADAIRGGAPAPVGTQSEAAAQRIEEVTAAVSVEGDPERKLALLCELAGLRADTGDLDGGIAVLRQALSVAPGDIQVMHQLATYLLARAERSEPARAEADHNRVAELFYRIAQGVEVAQSIDYLVAALDAVPTHDGALAMLEQVAAAEGREDLLPMRWVAYVSAAAEGPEVDRRRVSLGRAYIEAGQLEDALLCLGPPAEHGDRLAHQLLQQVYALQAQASAGGPPAPAGDTAFDAPAEAAAPDDADAPEAAAPPQRAKLPTTRPPTPPTEQEVGDRVSQLGQLRKRVTDLVALRRNAEAADLSKQILQLDPNDPEAFNFLESHYRKLREYEPLRELLLASTRVPGLSVEARRVRLKEIAKLSESRLRDAEGAISAWQSVATLEPTDREASLSLRRLLRAAERWEELAGVLEREALGQTNPTEAKRVLQELLRIQRDKRGDKAETAEALRQLHELDPEDRTVRDELCDLWLELERWEDAVPVLRERIEASPNDREKHRWLGTLASILEQHFADPAGVYEACERLLEIKADDLDAFDRMARVDEANEDWERLVKTLRRKAERMPTSQRAEIFVRMGTIAEEKLGDVDKAAEYLGEALDLRPDDEATLRELVGMFERAGRYADLVELLRERAMLEKDPKARAALHRRMAEILVDQLVDVAGASEAYERLLEIEEDEKALRHLRDAATDAGDHAKLADLLERLARVVPDTLERRDLLLERADLLHDSLSRGAEAVKVLDRILDEIDAAYEPAVDRLVVITESIGDRRGYAKAIGRRLDLAPDAEARLPIARELADLHENELHDVERAVTALERWAEDDERSAEPHRRLRKLHEEASNWKGLLDALDALAAWEDEFEARDEASLAAAQTAFEKLADAEGAWKRLEPMVREGHVAAEALLKEVAAKADRQRHLAAFYVKLAQESEDPATQGRQWGSAAEVFEKALDQPGQALEASLRMLATDLDDRDHLAVVDRLAVVCKAWPRLAQVYDRLLRKATSDDEKVELLRRHAALIEAAEPSAALDRVLRACALDPQDEDLLALAERLARESDRSQEMIVVYDRRRAKVEDDATKVDLLLRSAKLCDSALRDRDRANAYLKSALVAGVADSELAARVERTARELDAAHPEHESALRALVRAHTETAEKAAKKEPEAAARLVLRAAELSAGDLQDERAAFEILRSGAGLLPMDDAIYERLLEMATQAGRLDALDAHLQRLIREAIDSETTIVLLERRGYLLEGELDRQEEAADVYAKLMQLDPDHAWAGDKLRKSLRRSARYQELLIVIDKQLARVRDPATEIELLREVATTWERYLRNRWEAADAWKKVLSRAPDDEEAKQALARVQAGELAQPEPEPAEARSLRAPPRKSAAPQPMLPAAGVVLEHDAEVEAAPASASPVEAEASPPVEAEASGDALDAAAGRASEPAAEDEGTEESAPDEPLSTSDDGAVADAGAWSDVAPDEVAPVDAARDDDAEASARDVGLDDVEVAEADAAASHGDEAAPVVEDGLDALDSGFDAPEELDLAPSVPPPAPAAEPTASGRASSPPRPGSIPPPLPTFGRGSTPPSPSRPPPRTSSTPPPPPPRDSSSRASTPPPLPRKS